MRIEDCPIFGAPLELRANALKSVEDAIKDYLRVTHTLKPKTQTMTQRFLKCHKS